MRNAYECDFSQVLFGMRNQVIIMSITNVLIVLLKAYQKPKYPSSKSVNNDCF